MKSQRHPHPVTVSDKLNMLTGNKHQLSLTNPHDVLHRGKCAANK